MSSIFGGSFVCSSSGVDSLIIKYSLMSTALVPMYTRLHRTQPKCGDVRKEERTSNLKAKAYFECDSTLLWASYCVSGAVWHSTGMYEHFYILFRLEHARGKQKNRILCERIREIEIYGNFVGCFVISHAGWWNVNERIFACFVSHRRASPCEPVNQRERANQIRSKLWALMLNETPFRRLLRASKSHEEWI